jgi:hypothetical protein
VQTEVNFWFDFVDESCELLAVDGCIQMFDGMDSGKPENDGLVEVEVPKAKPSSKSNSPTKRNKKMRGKQWKNKRRSHIPTDTNPYHQTFEYNHQQQGVHNFPPQNQPRNSPQFAPYTQLFSTPPFCSLQFSPSDQSHYFLRYKVRP